jgi:hypothetical protein
VLYDSLLNTFELCTKRSPRRLGVHAWEKYLTVEEFQELSKARDASESAEIRLDESFSPALVQVIATPQSQFILDHEENPQY